MVNDDLQIVGRGYRELPPQHFPRPGWVEHDPREIWQSVLDAAAAAGGAPDTVAITNQRETTILWDRATGEPVAPAIVWQDRRTAERCRELDASFIHAKTGLVPDPYFSATKLEWLLREHGRRDGLAFGTVDSWLVWQLTGGAEHVIDVTNASRTLLVSLETLDWDDELLALFGVDRALLPRIVGSADEIGEGRLHGRTVTIRGIAGDQQAALYWAGLPQLPARARPPTARAPSCSSTPAMTGAGAAARPPEDRGRRRVRDRGCRADEWCGHPVAARRARDRRRRRRDRDACRERGVDGRRPFRAPRSPGSARRSGTRTRVASSPV